MKKCPKCKFRSMHFKLLRNDDGQAAGNFYQCDNCSHVEGVGNKLRGRKWRGLWNKLKNM